MPRQSGTRTRTHGAACIVVLTMFVAVIVAAGSSSASAASESATLSVTVASAVSVDASGCANGTSYRATVLADSPLGYWRLGDPGATATDTGSGSQHGTYRNGPATSAGAIGGDSDGSRTFDGNDDNVEIADVHDFTGTAAFSVEAWIRKTADATVWSRIVSKEQLSASREGWLLFIGAAGDPNSQKLGFARFGNDVGEEVVSTTVTETGRWYHVVATYDGTTMRMYVNGSLESSEPGSVSVVDHGFPLRFGDIAEPGLDFQEFNGAIDEVAIYGSALPGARVAAHYAAGTAGNTHDLGSALPSQNRVSTSDCTVSFGSSNDTAMLRIYQQDGGGNAMHATPLSGVVSHWPLNGSGTDMQGRGDVTLQSSPATPSYVAGPAAFGQGLSFDGDDGASIPYDSAYDLDVFTLDFWFRSSALGPATFPQLVNKADPANNNSNNNFELHFVQCACADDGRLVFKVSVSGTSNYIGPFNAVNDYVDGQWHHIAAVVDGSRTMRLYVDGVERASAVLTAGDLDNAAFPIDIGKQGSWGHMQGEIDELRISNVARSAAEIRSYFLGQVADYSTGVSDWTSGTNMFGACLRAVSGSGVAGTWQVNATCPSTSGSYWNAIPPTAATPGSKVASSPTSGTNDATASLRFGFRPSASQPVGEYAAPVVLEVVAPEV